MKGNLNLLFTSWIFEQVLVFNYHRIGWVEFNINWNPPHNGKLINTSILIRNHLAINNYDFIFEMDADFSHNPKDLIRLFYACASPEELKSEKIDPSYALSADMSIGSRYINGVNVVNWPMDRVLMSYFAGFYVRFITGMPIQDATAGFVCYRKKVLETIPLDQIKFIGYAFQVEMKFTTWKYKFNILEVPIIFTDRTKGTSKMSANIFKEAIFGVIQLKINSLFNRYHRAS